MGVMPVRQLLITMSLPMMISMLVQALYNVVDSMFVSYISEYALTAVGLAFPAQNLMISVGVGTGVGVNALLSKSLGEKNFDAANKAAVNGIFLAFCSWAVFALLGGFFSRTFMILQTDVPEIIAYGDTYLTIIAVASAGMMFQICFERLLQSTGKTIYTMLSQGLGAVINLILDPLFIFGLGPFPAMGIAGAALATVTGQCVGALLGLLCNLRRNPEITLSFRGFRPHGVTIRKIYAVGVPSIIMASIGSVMTFGMNKILGAFNSTAVAVFSAYFKLESFIFMPVFGINNAALAIAAYNYGARKPKRILGVLKCGILGATALMLIGVAAFQLIPQVLLGLFNANADMLAVGDPALRTMSLAFVFAGACIIVGGVFQALGNSVYSMIVSIARQLVVLLPVAYLLSLSGNIDAVWFAFPIAEVASLTMTVILFLRLYRKKIRPLSRMPAAE